MNNSLKINLDTIQQKAKERTVKTQNVEYDLDTLVKRIKKNLIKLDPDYQRRHRWTKVASSKLIESLILNIPIPVIFISQDVDVDDEVGEYTSRFTVIDGQQRLTAIYDFMTNAFELEGLETLPELNGLSYHELPPFLFRRLEERTIRCMRIDSTIDSQVKYDIFERLNTGSVKLESQELRNATARGPFNDLTKELAKDPNFKLLIQVKEGDEESNQKIMKMDDVELVLRFFALTNGKHLNLRKGFKDFLTSSLIELNKLSPHDIEQASLEFKTYMAFIANNIGSLAFSKWRIDATGVQKKMSNFNAAVYDAVIVGMTSCFTLDDLNKNPPAVMNKISGYRALFGNQDFFNAVSGSVNDAAKVKTRIDLMISYLSR